MTVKLHPNMEKKAKQLAEFRECADVSHLISELIKLETEKPAFKAFSDNNPLPNTERKIRGKVAA